MTELSCGKSLIEGRRQKEENKQMATDVLVLLGKHGFINIVRDEDPPGFDSDSRYQSTNWYAILEQDILVNESKIPG